MVFVWFEVEEVVMVQEKKLVNILCNRVSQKGIVKVVIVDIKGENDLLSICF